MNATRANGDLFIVVRRQVSGSFQSD